MHGMLAREYNLIIHTDISAHETSHFQFNFNKCADFISYLCSLGYASTSLSNPGLLILKAYSLFKLKKDVYKE
jgi:hypothetical protein